MATTPVTPAPRSEDDIIQKIVRVTFGETEYEIPVLPMGKARKWREGLINQVQAIAGQLGAEADNSKTFVNGLAFVFLQFPEKLADLVFSYAPSLPRTKIEGDGTDENPGEGTEQQLAVAFGKIMQVAFPFVGELRTITQTLGVMASFPQSVRSSK